MDFTSVSNNSNFTGYKINIFLYHKNEKILLSRLVTPEQIHGLKLNLSVEIQIKWLLSNISPGSHLFLANFNHFLHCGSRIMMQVSSKNKSGKLYSFDELLYAPVSSRVTFV